MLTLREFVVSTVVAIAVAEVPAMGPGSAVLADNQRRPTLTLSLTSPSFVDQGEIPAHFTCEGADAAPALRWAGLPGDAKSLVLIVDDPDAPDPAAPKMTWVHWLLYNLPPTAGGLAQAATGADLPPGTREGLNDWKRTGYGGPCPPIGRHRYFFKLYALNTVLPDLHRPTKPALEKAMQGHVVAQATLMGTYVKEANR